jgi:hypothetical protein
MSSRSRVSLKRDTLFRNAPCKPRRVTQTSGFPVISHLPHAACVVPAQYVLT